MGEFDIDDLLRDLGDEDPKAPREPSFEGAADSDESGTAPPTPAPAAANASGAETSLALPSQIESDVLSTGDVTELLVLRQVITPEQLTTAKRVLSQSPGRKIQDVLIEMGVEDVDVQRAIADHARIAFEEIDTTRPETSIDIKMMHRLTADFCKSSVVLPLRREGRRLVVGTASPDDVFVLDDVKRRLGVSSIKHVLVARSQVHAVIDAYTEETSQEEETPFDVEDILSDVDEDDVEVQKDSKDDMDDSDADSSPVVRYVNHIIQTALKEGASDIHIEPGEKQTKVRYRIDGILFEMMAPPRKMHAAITSRLKIMANLDIAERRLPQDGRIRVNVLGRQLDLRMSTIPTPKGEKTVMRILDNRAIQVTLDELGFHEDTLTIWKHQIDQPHGIILVTGPTGSGKTTTLYSSLQQLDLKKLNVSTVEDPVEYNLADITQIQTHERIGMTFEKALKALMRQDPDVIMLGEIRDMETATIAIQAALTGHLVLSTLHTNDAPSSVTRLTNIGIESFLIAAALNSVLAQRLVRRICPNCSREVAPQPDVLDFMQMHGLMQETVAEGAGCERCRQTGYSGRYGLYELLLLDDFLRDAIASNPNVTEFRRTCSERGMVTLREDGMRKVADGRTTVSEVLRVTEATI